MAQPETPDISNLAVRSASSLMALQVFSRFITFALNQALVRLASPAVYGTASIQLELLLNTILFLSREGFRNALLRADIGGEKNKGTACLISNISLLPVYLGGLVSVFTSMAYVQFAPAAAKAQPYFFETVALFGIAALIELSTEPMHIISMQSLKPTVRVKAEGLAMIVKSIITVLVLVRDPSDESGLLAFGVGQLAFSTMLLIMYLKALYTETYFVFRRSPAMQSSKSKYLPSSLKQYFDENILEVSIAMTGQGIMKHFLTEGDKVIISRVSPLKDQGGYAIANNYGALIARVIFQPIEESSRLFFSKTMSVGNDTSSAAFDLAISRLSLILFVYNHFSLLLLSFGPPYLSIALATLLPSRYISTSAPAILAAWIWYMPVLAINGVLEAFVSSTASPKELAHQSRWMAGASVAYLALSVGLYRFSGLGDAAIIYANIANSLSRVIYCSIFVRRLTRRMSPKGKSGLSYRHTLPTLPVILFCFFAGMVTRYSARRLEIEELAIVAGKNLLLTKAAGIHLVIGATLGMIALSVCAISEKNSIQPFLSFSTNKKTD